MKYLTPRELVKSLGTEVEKEVFLLKRSLVAGMWPACPTPGPSLHPRIHTHTHTIILYISLYIFFKFFCFSPAVPLGSKEWGKAVHFLC